MESLDQTLIHLTGKKGLGHRHHAQRKDHVSTQQGSHPQAKERGLRRNQPCRHLDLDLWASGIERNKFLLFKHPWSLAFCYGSPYKLI